jgi:hypothetical protein
VPRRQLNVRFQEEDWKRLADLQQQLGYRSQYEVLHLALIELEKVQCSETPAPPAAAASRAAPEQANARAAKRQDWCQRCRRLGMAVCPACLAIQGKGKG